MTVKLIVSIRLMDFPLLSSKNMITYVIVVVNRSCSSPNSVTVLHSSLSTRRTERVIFNKTRVGRIKLIIGVFHSKFQRKIVDSSLKRPTFLPKDKPGIRTPIR